MKNVVLILPFLLFFSSATFAETAPNIQEIRLSLDSVWVVVGGILVFFMQAGFALIEFEELCFLPLAEAVSEDSDAPLIISSVFLTE